MAALIEIQALVRRAMTSGTADAELAPLLVGGRDARRRFAVHQRHYEASLVASLLDTFPATVWLAGSAFITEAARQFVRTHPPERPCIAEYGAGFPDFLSTCEGAARVPYLQDFATLEWHVGRVTLTADAVPFNVDDLSPLNAEHLAEAAFTMQMGVHYLQTSWAVDELMTMYVTDSAPEEFTLAEDEVRLEIRGARGEFRIGRMNPGDFAFRRGIWSGLSVAEAAGTALDAEPAFEPGLGLTALLADGLVAGIRRDEGEAT